MAKNLRMAANIGNRLNFGLSADKRTSRNASSIFYPKKPSTSIPFFPVPVERSSDFFGDTLYNSGTNWFKHSLIIQGQIASGKA
jgi:hypothetical protein